MMKQYRWVGEQRMIPGVGAPQRGEVIELKEDQGASLAAQGLCEEVASEKPVKAEKAKE